MIPDGYELVGDEYVRKISSLSPAEIEKQIENNAPLFFKNIGHDIGKVSRREHVRTVDYEYDDVGVEVTSVREIKIQTQQAVATGNGTARSIELINNAILHSLPTVSSAAKMEWEVSRT